MQYVLAFTALLLALALVFFWMMIRHQMDEMQGGASSDDSSSNVSSIAYTAEDEAHLLLIVEEEDSARFILVHADPANSAICVTGVPENALAVDGLSLTPLYQKHGAAYVVNQLAAKSGRPLRHYAAVSRSNAEKWFARLGNDLMLTLKGDVVLTDENGAQTTLTAGEHTLSAPQTTALLCHPSATEKLRADVIVAMLRQYLQSGRNLSADFSYLANMAQTDLRIGDFTGYRDRLVYLAEQNSSGNCSIATQAFTAITN
jgi:hypothetical protein